MGSTVDSCRMASCAALFGWSSAKGRLAASCQVASAEVATPWHMDIVHAARTPLRSMHPGAQGLRLRGSEGIFMHPHEQMP